MRGLTRSVWALSLPILFAEVGETVIYATDTAFLGRVGTIELASIGLADTVIEMAIVPAVGLIEAMQITIARRAGEQRDQAVGQTFKAGLLLVILTGVALAAGLKLASPAATELLVSSKEIAAALDAFLQIAAYGLVLMGVNLALGSLFVGLGRARILIGATLVLALTNLALSYLLVLGQLGAPQLGIEGAAYAFLGAEVATLLYLGIHALLRLDFSRYGLFRAASPASLLVRPLLRIASPVALQALVESARWFIFFLIFEQVSDDALAWASLVYACYAVLSIPALAFGEAVYTLASNVIGRGQPAKIPSLIRRAVLAAYLVTAPLLALALMFPDTALSVLTSDTESIDGARRGVQVVALGLLVVIPAEMWLAAVLGTGDADAAFLIELLLSALVLGAGVLSALILDLPFEYVWISLPAGAAVALLVSYAWLRSGRWERAAV